jgi:hypothetical protein
MLLTPPGTGKRILFCFALSGKLDKDLQNGGLLFYWTIVERSQE